MTETELYEIYAKWTGELHFWCVRELDRHIDVEFFPSAYEFKLYSGYAEEYSTSSGIPGLQRPPGERTETVRLLRPEQSPTQKQLETLFKDICLAAARVLDVRVGRARLEDRKQDSWTEEQTRLEVRAWKTLGLPEDGTRGE
jgi:hypothetical protein